jgi:hypothetical protein
VDRTLQELVLQVRELLFLVASLGLEALQLLDQRSNPIILRVQLKKRD